MFTQNILSNKIRVVTAPVPSVDSVTVLVLFAAGSRYEDLKINGIAHFLEHMFFKGAKKYKTPKDVSLAVDRLGGMFNAFTDKEYVGYYIRLASEHTETAFDILSDMLLYPAFPHEEINKERGVILEEMNMYQDAPAQQIFWDFERHLLGDQPIGWDEIGTKELINTVTQDDFNAYKEHFYTPDNMVVSVAGNVTSQQVKELTEKYFGSMEGTKQRSYVPFDESKIPEKKVSIRVKDTDQAHLMIGIRGCTLHDKDRMIQKLLSIALGGNSSSRMFQHLREEKGLCYYIHTGGSSYHDTGTFYAKAGITVNKIEEALPAIAEEFRKMLSEYSITQEELDIAKSYFKGTLVLSLEDTESLAHYAGKEWLLKDKITTIDELKSQVEAITLNDIAEFVKTWFKKPEFYLSVIGPYAGKEETFYNCIK
ncbi:MAG: M16 family metallopeptidase [Candidatus Gracilibacteria bacterium]